MAASSTTTATTPITQPLLALLPSYTAETLPPRLLSAASTLLSQSHQRAPHLKPDEEIARPYACAELAVDRLRAALRLPPKKTTTGGNVSRRAGAGAGPPCKPAAYKKLLAFLQGVLDKDGAAAGTPEGASAKRKRDAVVLVDDDYEGGEEEEEEAMATPSKRARGTAAGAGETPTRTPASAKKGSGFVGRLKAQNPLRKGGAPVEEAPALVLPAIRRLCKVYDTPVMAPHVYTGTCVVLKAAELWPPAEAEDAAADGFDADVMALVTALYLMVLTKMGKGQMKTKVFNGVSKKAGEMFGAKGLKKASAISDWIRRINSEGWCKGQDWFESVPEDVFAFTLEAGESVDDDEVEAEIHEDDDDHLHQSGFDPRRMDIDLNKEDPEGVLLPGLGTMMQPSVDWTSDDRRRQFAQWKKGIMKRLEEPAKQGHKGGIEASRSSLVH